MDIHGQRRRGEALIFYWFFVDVCWSGWFYETQNQLYPASVSSLGKKSTILVSVLVHLFVHVPNLTRLPALFGKAK